MIPGLAFIIIVYSLKLEIDYIVLLVILTILSTLPFVYLISFIFKTDMTTRNMIRFGDMLFGGVLSIMLFLFYFIWPDTLNILRYIPTIIPFYASCYALFTVIGKMLLNPFASSVLTFEIALIPILMMIFDMIFYLVLLWLAEEGFFIKRKNVHIPSESLDEEDVVEEEQRVS